MEIVKVVTSQNVEIDYLVASLGTRMKARAIDYSIFFGIYLLCMMIFVGSLRSDASSSPWIFGIATIVWLILCVFYDLVCEIFFNGQSIGKKVSKIKVISLNGERPTVSQYILRWLFRIVDFGVTLGTGAVTSVAVSSHKQRFGDIVAGTVVIKTQAITRYKDLTFKEIPLDYEITYPQVSLLTDEDLILIHDVFANFGRTKNSLLIYKLAIRIKDYLHVSYPKEINEYRFLETIVNDYISYTTKI